MSPQASAMANDSSKGQDEDIMWLISKSKDSGNFGVKAEKSISDNLSDSSLQTCAKSCSTLVEPSQINSIQIGRSAENKTISNEIDYFEETMFWLYFIIEIRLHANSYLWISAKPESYKKSILQYCSLSVRFLEPRL